MALTLDEIIGGITELAGDDPAKAKELATALRERAKPIAQVLINVGSALKKDEVKREHDALRSERDTAAAERDEAKQALEDERGKAPDAKAIEERLKAEHKKALDKANDRADTAEKRAKELNRQVARDLTISHLTTPDESGMYVDPEHAELLMIGRYSDRYVDREDGALDVLQIDETAAYDGKDIKEKTAALARDIRKKVQAKNLVTSTDSGGGIRGGGGGGGSYDPVKDGQERGKKQAVTATEKSLAYQ